MKNVFRIISKALFIACFGIFLSFAFGKETKAMLADRYDFTSNINMIAVCGNAVTPPSIQLYTDDQTSVLVKPS